MYLTQHQCISPITCNYPPNDRYTSEFVYNVIIFMQHGIRFAWPSYAKSRSCNIQPWVYNQATKLTISMINDERCRWMQPQEVKYLIRLCKWADFASIGLTVYLKG